MKGNMLLALAISLAFGVCTSGIEVRHDENLMVKYLIFYNGARVERFEDRLGESSVILNEVVDTLGYDEIRIAFGLSHTQVTEDPMRAATAVEVRLFAELSESLPVAGKTFHKSSESTIDGHFITKVMSDRTRIQILADDLPSGPYSVNITAYLIR